MVYVHDNRHFLDEGINVSSPLWISRIAILREYKKKNVQSSLISIFVRYDCKNLRKYPRWIERKEEYNFVEEIFKMFGIGEKYLSRRKRKKEKYSAWGEKKK